MGHMSHAGRSRVLLEDTWLPPQSSVWSLCLAPWCRCWHWAWSLVLRNGTTWHLPYWPWHPAPAESLVFSLVHLIPLKKNCVAVASVVSKMLLASNWIINAFSMLEREMRTYHVLHLAEFHWWPSKSVHLRTLLEGHQWFRQSSCKQKAITAKVY